MGTWTLGADNATVRNVPEPGPGADSGAAADSAVEPHQRDPVRRQVDLSRLDVQGRAPPASTTSPTTSATRCRDSKDDASSPGATESETNVPQNVRNIFDETRRVGDLELQPPSPVHRQRRLPDCRSSAASAGVTEALLGGWRVNAILTAQSGAPFTVNLSVDRANIGAGPAQRPDQMRRPEPAWRRANAGALVRHRGLRAARRRSPSAAPGATASSARASPTSTSRWRRRGRSPARRSSSSAGRCSTCSIAPTSICRTASSATRTSAGSSAPRTRARCSSVFV